MGMCQHFDTPPFLWNRMDLSLYPHFAYTASPVPTTKHRAEAVYNIIFPPSAFFTYTIASVAFFNLSIISFLFFSFILYSITKGVP